jgi:hypothetical protein
MCVSKWVGSSLAAMVAPHTHVWAAGGALTGVGAT